jgi:hypothetical protein
MTVGRSPSLGGREKIRVMKAMECPILARVQISVFPDIDELEANIVVVAAGAPISSELPWLFGRILVSSL